MSTLIEKYKHCCSKIWLQDIYKNNYAFVGIGKHSMANLYPVLHYFQVSLKYICCKSNDKLPFIENKYRGIKATSSIDEILHDDDVKGVFVSASPSSHFLLSSQVLKMGKSLFVEKPICATSEELEMLNGMVKQYGAKVVMVGMQKRYSPLSDVLKKRLKGNELISYNYRYVTGLYPEGDVLTELFIHPLDYVSFLFGKATVVGNRCIKSGNGGITYFLILQHNNIVGVLELSTAYSWSNAHETLSVNTKKGTFILNQMEELVYCPKTNVVCGIPVEKVFPKSKVDCHLYGRNNFVPSLVNNQIYSQGYFNEIRAFLNANERDGGNRSAISDMFATYHLIEDLNGTRK